MMVLLFFSLILPVLCAFRRSYRRGKVEINHVTLFSFGFIAYWVSPIMFGRFLGPQLSNTIGDELVSLYLHANNISLYLLSIIVIYLAFAAGDILASRIRASKKGYSKPLNQKLLFIITIFGSMIALAAVIQARDIIFHGGYLAENQEGRGTLAASCIFLFMVAMIHIAQTRPSTLRSLLLNRFLLPFWPPAFALCLAGTRLYFISFLLMLMVYWTVYRERVSIARFLFMSFIPLLLAGIAGAYRMGEGDHSVLANLIAEPMFTSFSLAAFLNWNSIMLWNLPIYIVSDLVNLVPSVLYPNKMVIDIPDAYHPLGALNSFVSFQENFGVLGTAVFMFLLGYCLERCHRQRNVIFRVFYVLTTGWLAFTFFRDPFSISLVKNILEFSLLLPATIIWLIRIMMHAFSKNRMIYGSMNETSIHAG